MSVGSTDNRVGTVKTVFDVIVILVIGLVAETAHFSWHSGRPVITGDCLQYVDAAEALLGPCKSPDFAVCKPGYPLILAGVALAVGNMSWAGVAVNHLFLALLPLAAYGLGRNLRSRLVGWIAAVLTIAQLQTYVGGGRLVPEAAYICFLSFGVLALATGLRSRRWMWPMVTAGLLLAAAWLIRSMAIVVIVAAVPCIIWAMRHRLRRCALACLCLALPVTAAVLSECSFNLAYGGQFRTSTGSLGTMLMMRARHLQGLPMPDTEAGRRCLALLPERSNEDAYRAAEADTWVARYRAVRDHGIDDWQIDGLMRQAALEMISSHRADFLACGFDVFVRHVLRRKGGPSYACVPPEKRLPSVVHPAWRDDPEALENGYAYWGLPHRALEESLDLAMRTKAAAARGAPFAEAGPFPAMRYLSTRPPLMDGLAVLRGVGSVWPGFAIILCWALGLNRRTCAFFAVAYLLDGALIAICSGSESAYDGYQSVWLATDTTLAAAFVTMVISVAAARVKATRVERDLAESAPSRAAEADRIRRRLAAP